MRGQRACRAPHLQLLRRYLSLSSANVAADESIMDASVVRLMSPGSRCLQLSRPQSGNLLTLECMGRTQDLLKLYEDNTDVKVIFFSSVDTSLFSEGLDRDEILLDWSSVATNISDVARKIETYDKPTVSVLSGSLSGTALGLYACADHRLMTPQTEFTLDELHRGYLPLGLASHLVHGCPEGMAFARYLGLSARPISGLHLYQLGVGTHLVEENALDVVTAALSHSMSPGLGTKTKQDHSIDASCLKDLLDTVHLESDLDVFEEEAWSKIFLVSPTEVEGSMDLEDGAPDDVDEIADAVVAAFGAASSVEESITTLQSIDADWAQEAAVATAAVDPAVAAAWYHHTAAARALSPEELRVREMACNAHLLRQRAAGEAVSLENIEALFTST